MFIFDRCRRSSAAVTPVKYEWNLKNVTGTFARLKIFACGEIDERDFSNPLPVSLYQNSNWATHSDIPLAYLI